MPNYRFEVKLRDVNYLYTLRDMIRAAYIRRGICPSCNMDKINGTLTISGIDNSVVEHATRNTKVSLRIIQL